MTAKLFQTGIYMIPDASRLTGVSPQRIRRWLRGYEFQAKHGRHRSAPVWQGQLKPIDNSIAVGFLDLMEIRCVDAFRRAGVSWKTLRLAHTHAQEVLKLSHPFCTNHFKIAGRDIILEIPRDDAEPLLWDIAHDQREFGRITRPFLKDLDFQNGELPQRWWPRGKNHLVALDPRRNFGQPIIFSEGVPTGILARSFRANRSIREVARWFEISPASVREAIEFERSLVE
ncbi:MAG TPA: DUF433 domain-containing protein, partial [Verrucomicrobiae bacterium]|nr:DUF433 domain-containing protein [Verrucomicrobiae bacterium]